MNQDAPQTIEQPAQARQATNEARMFSHFIQMLQDGEFHAELSDELREISAELSNHVLSYGGSPKATLTIKIDFQLKEGVFEISPDFTVKKPKAKRGRTIAALAAPLFADSFCRNEAVASRIAEATGMNCMAFAQQQGEAPTFKGLYRDELPNALYEFSIAPQSFSWRRLDGLPQWMLESMATKAKHDPEYADMLATYNDLQAGRA